MSIHSQAIVNLQTGEVTTVLEKYKIEGDHLGIIDNNQEAELWVYPAPNDEKRTRRSVIICPGGGYQILAFDHEGVDVAKWLNERGITAFVLKYRMPNGDQSIPLTDAYNAMKFVKDRADVLNLAKDKIGVLGFSAGGHLAASLSNCLQGENELIRPSFSILFYPVITMGDKTHEGSRANLLGKNVSEADIQMYSNELQVSKDTPPTILMWSDDDKTVNPANSLDYYRALKARNIPVAMRVFPVGGHGWGINHNFKYHDTAFDLLSTWLGALDE